MPICSVIALRICVAVLARPRGRGPAPGTPTPARAGSGRTRWTKLPSKRLTDILSAPATLSGATSRATLSYEEEATRRRDDGLQRSDVAAGLGPALLPAGWFAALLRTRSRLRGWVDAELARQRNPPPSLAAMTKNFELPQQAIFAHRCCISTTVCCSQTRTKWLWPIRRGIRTLSILSCGCPAPHRIVSAFGMDLLHDHTREGPLDWARPLTDQRSVLRPFNSLCKPTLIRERPDWAAGFHFSHRVPKSTIAPFLFLFHIAFVDNDLLFQRQLQRNT